MSRRFAGCSDGLRQMTLSAEKGQPRYEDSQHASGFKGLDRDLVVEAHEESRRMRMITLLSRTTSNTAFVTTTLTEAPPTVSASLSSLKVIQLPHLKVGKRHQGRVLHGRLCVKPFRIAAIFSVLEDECGRAARILIYNVLAGTASAKAVEDRFPAGMRVIVKEPFFKLCVDGMTAIRVDNPADITVDESWIDQVDSSLPPQDLSNDAKLTEELEAMRREGNDLFCEQNWIGAVNKYSQCIKKANSVIASNKSASSKLNEVLRLAYSNRAEGRLRLGAFEDALNDADKALEFDPKHVKSLVRRGKAAHSLGLFEKSCVSFKAALDEFPQDKSIQNSLKASTKAYKQSRHGKYDLSDFYVRDRAGDVPCCADFVGPVEIRRVHNSGIGERGLFATKSVKSGQLLLVSNPLAILRQKLDWRKMHFNFNIHRSFPSVKSGIQQNFISEIANQIMMSQRKMAQLYSLASHGKHEMEIPSMELFRPGSEWVPPGAEKLEVDMGLISDIVKINAFGSRTANHFNDIGREDISPSEVEEGIWVLPSFANHSCAPTCLPDFIGDTMFVRAAKDIVEGEELTVPYFIKELFQGLGKRQAASQNWFLTCKCERCLLEGSLQPQLAKITKGYPKLLEAAVAETRKLGGKKDRAVKELSNVADQVEAFIQSLDAKLKPQQQSWVRAAFQDAYIARFEWTIDEHDSRAKIASLQLAVDSAAAVCVGNGTLILAAVLLRAVERRSSKQSQAYRSTLDRVLAIYTIAFGKQPTSVMHKLIDARWCILDLEMNLRPQFS